MTDDNEERTAGDERDASAGDLRVIPLFPLNMTLFPGMVQPLHIFEPRYRQMTTYCLDTNVSFGIVLALPEGEREQEVPAHVGALARIVDYHRLPDGRYNLLTIGSERFEIVETRHDKPYLTAQVRLLHDDDEGVGDAELGDVILEARTGLEEYLRLMLELIGSEEREISIPADSTELSFLIAVVLTVDDAEKQRLLEIPSTAKRLRMEVTLLADEIRDLKRQLRNSGSNPDLPDFGASDRSALN